MKRGVQAELFSVPLSRGTHALDKAYGELRRGAWANHVVGWLPLLCSDTPDEPVGWRVADQWNRKTVMILSDLTAGLSTITALIVMATNHLQNWYLCVAGAFAGALGSSQFPAYAAAMTPMIPKRHFGRTMPSWEGPLQHPK